MRLGCLPNFNFVDCIWETQELIFTAAKNKFDRDRAIGHRLFDVAIRDSFRMFRYERLQNHNLYSTGME